MKKLYQSVLVLTIGLGIFQQFVSADDIDIPLDPSTVVYVKITRNNPNPVEKEVEKRVQEELDRFDSKITVIIVSPTNNSEIEHVLSVSAVSNKATASFSVSKQSGNGFVVSLFIPKQRDRAETYKEIFIPIPTNVQKSEQVEIVSLKAVEAVQASVLAVETAQASPASNRDFQAEKLKITISENRFDAHSRLRLKGWGVVGLTGLVAGALTLGAGGILHILKDDYVKKANAAANEGRNYDLNSPSYLFYYNKYVKYSKMSDQYKTAAIVSSAVGGALAAVSAVGIVIYLEHVKKKNEAAAFVILPVGTGIIGEF